ncbi:MAG: telomerase inhibitor [Caeruleum heppii]|nr:MAG: telomerase inhibitor [Caeruleum heppii]
MGLAGPRKRTKISHDPNNTTWTRDTTTFGHRILAGHGWRPGDLLGAQDAPHAVHHTAANESFIRIAPKDDNLGIGAKRGPGQLADECTGLDDFQGILGRLNSKNETSLRNEETARAKIRQSRYLEHRLGLVNFVKGGLLLGQDFREIIEVDSGESKTGTDTVDAEELPEPPQTTTALDRRKLVKDANAQSESTDPEEGNSEERAMSKRKRKREKRTSLEAASETKQDEPLDKEERRQRKLMRRTKKEAKKKAKEAQELCLPTSTGTSFNLGQSAVTEEEKGPLEQDIRPTTTLSAPVPGHGARQVLRQRYIRQKRMSVIDSASLKEIFMMKA